MPRTSTSELTCPSLVTPVAGATEVVEAGTTEAAVATAQRRLGPDAHVVESRRVLRGGIGGFFAKEVVQLHVRPGPCPGLDRPTEPGLAAIGPAPGGTGPSPADIPARPSPVDRLLDGASDAPASMDFATYLRSQFEPDVAERPELAPPPRASMPAGSGGPPWSTSALFRLGLPVELVRSLGVGPEGDDLAWTAALADAVRPNCRPLPHGPAVLVGPRAHLLNGIVASPTARSQTWLAALGAGRWHHLVVGGEGWRAALAGDPLAVSWTRPEDLPDALRCATELGLVLGYGPLAGEIRRARPLDVALSLRASVEGAS
jgi:hypothetical protein